MPATTLSAMKLCFVGGGKMAEALIGGLVTTGWAEPTELGCIEIVAERRAELGSAFPGLKLVASCVAAGADPAFDVSDVLVAVKPQHVAEVQVGLVPS